jgi:hypothetical protein
VIAYNSNARNSMLDPSFEPGIWRARRGADGAVDLERLRDGWRFADFGSDDEVVVLAGGTARPIQHGSYLVRLIRRGGAASTPRASALVDDVAELMDAVVARVALDSCLELVAINRRDGRCRGRA